MAGSDQIKTANWQMEPRPLMTDGRRMPRTSRDTTTQSSGRGAAMSTHMRRPHKLAQGQPKSCQGDIPVRSVASSPTPKRCPMTGEGGTVTSPDRIGLGGTTWLGTTGLGGRCKRALKMPCGISGVGMAASPLRQRPHLDRTLWLQQIGRQASPKRAGHSTMGARPLMTDGRTTPRISRDPTYLQTTHRATFRRGCVLSGTRRCSPRTPGSADFWRLS